MSIIEKVYFTFDEDDKLQIVGDRIMIDKVLKRLTDMVSDVANEISRWISVKDRLPEDKKSVLVFLKILYEDIKIAYCDDRRFYINGANEHITQWVTHWLPLPEPPSHD